MGKLLKTKTFFGVLAVVAALAVSSPARGRRPASTLPPVLVQALKPLVSVLRSQGLPASVLEDKAREGLAKNVPVARIIPALQRLAGFIREGGTRLGKIARWPKGKVPPSLVRAYGEARFSGVAASDAVRVARAARLPRDWRIARAGVDLLADLTVTGYPSSAVGDMAVRLVQAGQPARFKLLKTALNTLTLRYGLGKTEAIRTLAKVLMGHRGNLSAAMVHLRKIHVKKVRSSPTKKQK